MFFFFWKRSCQLERRRWAIKKASTSPPLKRVNLLRFKGPSLGSNCISSHRRHSQHNKHNINSSKFYNSKCIRKRRDIRCPWNRRKVSVRPLESLVTSASVDFSNFLLVGFESTGTTDEEEVDVELPPPMPLVSTATCVTHNNNPSADNSTTPLADLHSQVTGFTSYFIDLIHYTDGAMER